MKQIKGFQLELINSEQKNNYNKNAFKKIVEQNI